MRDVPIGRNAPAAVAPINFAARRREIVSCIVTPTLTAILVGWAFWVNRRCRRFLPSRLIFLTGSRFRRNSDRLAEQTRIGFHDQPVDGHESDISSLRLLDYVLERKPIAVIGLFHQTIFDGANFFRGLLGANVIFADVKNHALNKLEGMSQH